MHHRDRNAHADLLAAALERQFSPRRPQAVRRTPPKPRSIWTRLVLPVAALVGSAVLSLYALLWLLTPAVN